MSKHRFLVEADLPENFGKVNGPEPDVEGMFRAIAHITNMEARLWAAWAGRNDPETFVVLSPTVRERWQRVASFIIAEGAKAKR